VGEDVAGALHFDAWLHVNGLRGRGQAMAHQPGRGASGSRSGVATPSMGGGELTREFFARRSGRPRLYKGRDQRLPRRK
jgi:hypothetical protein